MQLRKGNGLEAQKHPFTNLMTSREVCFLSGSCLCDITDTLPSLSQFTGYYALLFFHGADSDTGRNSLRRVKEDYRALGRVVFISPPGQMKDLKGPV